MLKQFPDGFIWGASTASYQIEGATAAHGRSPSIWDTFAHTPGKVQGGDTGDAACDHYHRYRDDIALARRLGLKAYRFSTAWPRILPVGTGQINGAGLDFYERLVDALLEAGVTPWLCLYHWDLPQALQDRGGWQNRDIAHWFADYATVVARRLGDRVKHMATLNEPNVFSILGHGTGDHAPGLKNRAAVFAAIHHANLAHGRGIAALRANAGDLVLGVINNLGPVAPAPPVAENRQAAEWFDALWNRAFADPQFLGRYPARLEAAIAPYQRADDLATIAQPLDYFGLNHYSRMWVSRDGSAALGCQSVPPPPGTPVTGMGWEINPQVFYEQLLDLGDRYPGVPIYVTENGAGYEEKPGPDGRVHDDNRVAFLAGYLDAVHRAIEAGVNVGGYFVWSLLDNFEWAYGYAKRFGIVHVDYRTMARNPKQSFDYYSDVVAANGIVPAENRTGQA
jgi:beta-glucosidase